MNSAETPTIEELLRFMASRDASDLHLKPMRPPLVRINGKLLPLKTEPLKPDNLQEMLLGILDTRMREQLDRSLAADFGYSVPGVSRFRASVFYQRGTLSAAFRRVPFDFPSLDDWGLPPVLTELSSLPQGLILITGPTGSGKSSTLAALMQQINDTRLVHVVTIEDPIEFLLRDNLGAVTQREVGTDTPGFDQALRNALRQDPDVIMVGEMRDRETMRTVLTAAETGHLVFSTLHTNSAVQTIDRIIDSFDDRARRQIRQQLAAVLQAVVSLKLVELADGSGLIAAVEVLRQTPRVSKLILDGNLEALAEEIESSVTYHKMQSMNQSLAALVLHERITRETALAASTNPGDLDLILRKALYASGPAEATGVGDDPMAESFSDYSKIVELQEIKKLYDEQQDRHRAELSERDAELERLRAELAGAPSGAPAAAAPDEDTAEIRRENERLNRQLQRIREEYEAKIERLNARIRDLSDGTGETPRPPIPAEPERRGFFRR